MILPERLESDGLVLRRWTVDDAETLAKLVEESADHLRPWMAWVDEEPRDVEAVREMLARWERRWRSGGELSLAIVADGIVTGSCSVQPRDGGLYELGYWLHPGFTGRGVATRAAGLLTDAVLALPGTTAVEIRHDRANEASGAVPRRLGYAPAGEAPNPVPGTADSGTDEVWRKEPVVLREATLDDVDALAAGAVAGVADYPAFAPPGWTGPTLGEETDHARELLADPRVWCCVGVLGSAIVGQVTILPASIAARAVDTPGLGHLRNLFVDREHWGSSLARDLHAAAVREARTRGFDELRLFVAAGQARARRFYDREGWRQVGDPFFDPVPGLEMLELRLDPSTTVAREVEHHLAT